MLASFIDEHELARQGREVARRGREARDWLAHEEHAREVARRGREVARRGREVRQWLDRDERRRVVALVVLSIAVSVAMSLLATAIAAAVRRRRAAAEPAAEGEGISSMAARAPGEVAADVAATEGTDVAELSDAPERTDGPAPDGD
ncbi:MAG: hypothetical protein MUC54_02455 [Chloroflexi bacterium]|nr:hypothetical protein [Chloroflexota bacterium]